MPSRRGLHASWFVAVSAIVSASCGGKSEGLSRGGNAGMGGSFEAGIGGGRGGNAGVAGETDASTGLGRIQIGSGSHAVDYVNTQWLNGSTSTQLTLDIGYGGEQACLLGLIIFFRLPEPIDGTPTADGYLRSEVPSERVSGDGSLRCPSNDYLALDEWSGALESRRDLEPFVRAIQADFAATDRTPAISLRIPAE